MSDAATAAYMAERLGNLRQSAVSLLARLVGQSTVDTADREREAEARCDSAQTTMQVIAGQCTGHLNHLADAAQDAALQKRLFQADRGLFRDLKTPDKLVTAFLLMIGWLIESIFTTVGLYADGHADLIPALGFAVTFSTVNVGLGLAAGSCIRYLRYRIRSATPHPDDRLVRGLAAIGTGIILSVAALMIFVAGRVRVTGQHDGIFDFSEVSSAATFGDGLALVIMVAAALSCAMAAAKAYGGFVDSEPGYADHAGTAVSRIHEEAEALIEQAQEDIEALYEDAEDELLEILEDDPDGEDLISAVLAFNAEVETAKDAVLARAQAAWERSSFIAGKPLPQNEQTVDAFDTLLIDVGHTTATRPKRQTLDRLREAHAEASARISESFTHYLANAQQNRMPPPGFTS